MSASPLPPVKRAITGAGKFGLASVPFGAKMVIGRVSPEFCGMIPCTALSSSTDLNVSQIAMSVVPT